MLLSMLFISSCKESSAVEPVAEKTIIINNFEVSKKHLTLNPNKGKWYYKDEPFNGYSIANHPNGNLSEKLGYLNGKREGIAKKWEANGTLRIQSYYKQNRLVGNYKVWWPNGKLAEESTYVDGALEGTQKMWYANGVLAKERKLSNGKEKGLQKAWLQNGKLYVNYEAKNGRIFGMRRANSCYQLEDEVVVRN